MKPIILPEIVAAGVYNAQVAFKGKTVSPNRRTTMFEIELPLDDGGISYIDETAHAISESIVICAKPGQIRHTRLPFRCHYIHIIVNEGELLTVLFSLPNYIEVKDTSEVRKILLELCKCYNDGLPEQSILMQSLLLKLIYILRRESTERIASYIPKSGNRSVIEQTVSYIRDNPTADLSLQALASKAKFSPVYFHKLFKASTGKTLHEYVEEQKIKKAIDIMVSTDLTLTQIAYECGFSSQSYFNSAFKKKMNLTPREYEKNVISKYEKYPE